MEPQPHPRLCRLRPPPRCRTGTRTARQSTCRSSRSLRWPGRRRRRWWWSRARPSLRPSFCLRCGARRLCGRSSLATKRRGHAPFESYASAADWSAGSANGTTATLPRQPILGSCRLRNGKGRGGAGREPERRGDWPAAGGGGRFQ